jgi:hypothetical protein
MARSRPDPGCFILQIARLMLSGGRQAEQGWHGIRIETSKEPTCDSIAVIPDGQAVFLLPELFQRPLRVACQPDVQPDEADATGERQPRPYKVLMPTTSLHALFFRPPSLA